MSFYQENGELLPLEVELSLVAGLPGIQFLGLPDQQVKESATRIKNAIKSAGFEFPKTEQILVNLRPNHIKKTSRGLDLAVAAAFLWETEQVAKPVLGEMDFIYGELTLSGRVLEPDDLSQFLTAKSATVWTGQSESPKSLSVHRKVASELKDLQVVQHIHPELEETPIRPQEALGMMFSKKQAELIEIIALGKHSGFFAGAAGSGKTTLAKAIHEFLPAPDSNMFFEIRKRQMIFGDVCTWRPLVKPHHTTPIISMVGGGSVPCAGEISRAHLGTLLLDEFFEFKTPVLEALRQPMEEKRIRIFRRGGFMDFPCHSVVLATTNLCPCGVRTPNKKVSCSFTRSRCDSYMNRFTGPVLDRFEILEFLDRITKFEVSGKEILERVEKARRFAQERLRADPDPFRGMEFDVLLPRMDSERRRQATKKVARTIADLAGSPQIQAEHVQKALEITYLSFERLKRWDR